MVDPQAALVRDLHRRLGEHQRTGGLGAVEAPSRHVVEQGLVVELGVVAAQRELEAVLALGGAMAGARGAADLVHDWQHVADEGHRFGGGRGGRGGVDGDRDRGGQAAGLDGDRAVAVAAGGEEAVFAALDGGGVGADVGVDGEVDVFAGFENAGDDELAAVAVVVEGEFGRLDEELDGGGVIAGGGREGGGEEEEECQRRKPDAGRKAGAPSGPDAGAPSRGLVRGIKTCHLAFTSIRASTGVVVYAARPSLSPASHDDDVIRKS